MPKDEYGEWSRDGLMPCGELRVTGTVQLPREFLEFLTWREGDRITAQLTGDDRGLMLYRSRDLCAHCGYTEELLRVRRGDCDTNTCICRACYHALKLDELRGRK